MASRYTLLILLACSFAACRKNMQSPVHDVFVKFYPTDSSNKVAGAFQLSNGNYLSYGFGPNIYSAPLLIVTDPNGNFLFDKKLNAQFAVLKIKPLTDGNILVAGINPLVSKMVSVWKMSPELDSIFSYSYTAGGVTATQDNTPDFVEFDGGFAITGYARPSNYAIPYLLQIDPAGQNPKLVYFDTLYPQTNVKPIGITRYKDGFTIAGTINSHGFTYGGKFVLRLDADCKVMWDTTMFDTTGEIDVAGIAGDNVTNTSVICGAYYLAASAGTLFAQSIDAEGVADSNIFYKDYENRARFRDIAQTSDGGYILAGTANMYGDNDLVSYSSVYLLKVDANLKEEWSKQFHSTKPATGVSAVQTADGGYLIGSYEHTASYKFTMMLIKTNANGDIVESK